MNDFALMDAAVKASRASNDPRTQTGVVVCNKQGTILAIAHNMFPHGVEETPERWTSEEKANYVVHAELAAVYAMASRGVATKGTTIFCTFSPCVECAKAIINSGMVKIVVLKATWDAAPEHWSSSLERGRQLLKEAGVEYVLWDQPLNQILKFTGIDLPV